MSDPATTEPAPPGPRKSTKAKLTEFVENMDPRAWRAVALSAASVVILLVLIVVGRLYYGEEIEGFINATLGEANRGHWGLLATILVFTLTAYVGAPQIALILACVVAFGPEQGFWNAWIATIVSGVATYFTGRLAGAEAQKRFGGATGGRFTRFMGKNGFWASFIVRFVPTGPFVVVNMAFGAARVNFWAFIAGLTLGVLPKTAGVAFFGDSILDALEGEFVTAALMALLAIAVWAGVVLAVRWWMRRDKDSSDQD